jgi:hypothetical protein
MCGYQRDPVAKTERDCEYKEMRGDGRQRPSGKPGFPSNNIMTESQCAEFDDPSADIVLVSSEKKRFRVDSWMLKANRYVIRSSDAGETCRVERAIFA